MNERLKTHSKTQKKSADLVSNKLRIGVFQQYQMKCKSVSKKSPRYTKKTQMPSMNEAVKQIEQEVLTTWPAEAISHAENVVYRLSGMYEFVVNDAPEQAEDAGPAEPVSAGKCSTVS
ncbi:TPA: phage minor tail protein G [Escherichia coli]